ncbi:MAG: flagellin lysine-N-methylase, partial [Oscillospiraceae bacterium]|jgi:lysine-N-methylase|nr:flagellin lysine-N-methylase [Oscillospiraceae bacterium]
MSCPEAARIALFSPEPMTFNLTERDIEVQGGSIKGSTRVVRDPKEGLSYKKHAWSIREGCIDIMQNRKRPINERILFIGIMLNKITEQIQQEDEEGVLGTIQLYVSAFSDSQFDGMMDSFQKSDGMRAAMTSILFNTCVEYMVMQKDSYEPFNFVARYLSEKGVEFKLDGKDMTPYLDIDEYIEEHCAIHWTPFLEEYGHVVENYFVNYIFSELFPFKYHEDGLTPYQHFIILAEQYALLRMLLCCNADEEEGVTKAQLTKTITALSHLNQHSQSPKRIIQIYGNSESDSVAHMSFMLR